MLTLVVSDLQWVKGPRDDPSDQCAHGHVAFAIDDVEFVRPTGGVHTVSSAALFLLRTLEHDHVAERRVTGGRLFPCCGFSMWPAEGEFAVDGIDCRGNVGVDPSVEHRDGRTIVRLRPLSGSVSDAEWRAGVLRFAEAVLGLYERCSPKTPPDDPLDHEGWALFWSEFHERRNRASKAL